MNWRGGLFRLWTLFSIVWALIVGHHYMEFHPAPAGKNDESQSSIDCGANPNAGPWCKYHENLKKYELISPDGTIYIVRIPADMTEQQVIEFVSINQSVMNPLGKSQIAGENNLSESQTAKDSQTSSLKDAIVTAISLPAAVLTSFMGFLWVLSGFKKRT